ncbi:MAG: fibrobacter succinogenes major paralogous domain-containing protein [Bacteroidota bacterium]
MKNLILISFSAVLLTMCLMVSCTKDDPKPAVLKSILVKTLPVKIKYYTGESLDLSGLVITLSFDNSTTEEVNFSDFANKGITCLPENGEIITETSTGVTITHTSSKKKAILAITIMVLTDIDDNTYSHVSIGNQIWMAENLKVTKFNDNTAIPPVAEHDEWDNSATPAYCWYNNDEATYSDMYGALYNWYTIETGRLCPDGWHVPSHTEWDHLKDFLSANGHEETEGATLRATNGWLSGVMGTDDYGFAALPGGYRGNGEFGLAGRYGYWWSSTEYSPSQGKLRIIMDLNDLFLSDYNSKNLGVSVRCLKD